MINLKSIPDEINVNVSNSVLTIDAKHEEMTDDGTAHILRHFTRNYVLPLGCDPGSITSDLSADGVLMIRAVKDPNALTYHATK